MGGPEGDPGEGSTMHGLDEVVGRAFLVGGAADTTVRHVTIVRGGLRERIGVTNGMQRCGEYFALFHKVGPEAGQQHGHVSRFCIAQELLQVLDCDYVGMASPAQAQHDVFRSGAVRFFDDLLQIPMQFGRRTEEKFALDVIDEQRFRRCSSG
jgi:hypothetical protein